MDHDQILTALRERILAFATSRVSRDHAEDFTQDVLAVLHDKYSHVTELGELVPLAFQILRYKMLDAHRKALRRGEYSQESVEDLPLADTGDNPMIQLDQKQRVDRLLTPSCNWANAAETVHMEVRGKEFPRDPNLDGPSLHQYDLHLGPALSETTPWPHGRILGSKKVLRAEL